MRPAQLNISLYKGGSWKKRLTFRVNGTPISLADQTFKAQIRPAYNSDVLSAEMSVTVDQMETGVLYLDLTAEQTAGLSGTLVWDLKSTDSETNEVNYWVNGNVSISGRVTV